MSIDPKLANVAALLADPTRARLVLALADGRAHTAKELAFLAGVSAATTSAHLARLLDMKLVAVTPRGRFRYYRIASASVSRMIEAIGSVAADLAPASRLARGDQALRAARTCYDHIAGRLGVSIAESLQARGGLILTDEAGEVTPSGVSLLETMGIDVDGLRKHRRVFCRPCLDWTERRNHIAGAVGAALCTRFLSLNWIDRLPDTRAVAISKDGRSGFREVFGIDVAALAEPTGLSGTS